MPRRRFVDELRREHVDELGGGVLLGDDLAEDLAALGDGVGELVDVLTAQLVYDPATRQRLLETREVMRRIERVSAEVVAMTSRIASSGPVN